MKRNLIILLLAILTLASCRPTAKNIAGSYSYKTSARVMVDDTSVSLNDEIGALTIITREDGSLLLTMNQLNGAVYTADAEWDAKSRTISLVPFTRVLRAGSILTQSYEVTISGEGEYLDETIVFTLSYEGESLSDESTLSGDDILMVAWR